MLTRQLAIISKYIQISNSKVYLKLTMLYVNYTSIFKKQKPKQNLQVFRSLPLEASPFSSPLIQVIHPLCPLVQPLYRFHSREGQMLSFNLLMPWFIFPPQSSSPLF